MSELTPEALRQTIEAMRLQLATTPGFTPEMIAQMLAPLLAELAALEQAPAAPATFAQTAQQVSSQLNIAHLYQIYLAAPGTPKLGRRDVQRSVEAYLTWVRDTYSGARLWGLASSPANPQQPRRRLQDVFVPLTLARFRPPREEDLEQLAGRRADPEALARAWVQWTGHAGRAGETVALPQLLTLGERIAIVGGAGSGKSTLLAYLAAALAEAAGQTPPYRLPFALPQPEQLPLPLLIPLRYYRDYLNRCARVPGGALEPPGVGTLVRFIPWYLQRRNPALRLSEDFFDRVLQGGGCLLLLDGLDEVVDRDERGQVRQEVEYMLNAVYPGNRCIVTAREAGYTHEAIFGEDFTRLEVQPLEDAQIEALVHNWCGQLYPGNADAQTEALMEAIREVNARRVREDLPPLVNTPLLTTMVISVKWDKAELPRERARLYEACVEVILQAQYVLSEETHDTARREMVEWGGPWEAQRDWLAQLALEMHRGGQDGSAVREKRLREILAPYLDPEALRQFIRAVRDRGGLLEERGEFFQFIHLTFQEFLAARLLAKQREAGWQQLLPYLLDPWWREVALLTYGFARADYAPAAREYLDWLSTVPEGAASLAGLELAGAALLELEQPDHAQRQVQAQRLAAALPQSGSAPATLRARAGATLARLGDPRPEVLTLASMGFCYVSPGRFWLGGERYDAERPADWYAGLDAGYWIGRYPVTVAQWREYVERSGHRPRNEDSLRGLDNHPVVRVTWFEAWDFTTWLTQVVRDEGWLPPGWELRLPSEVEWEKAARGGESIPAPEAVLCRTLSQGLDMAALPLIPNPLPRREYPWGLESDPERANIDATGIGTTSAVGCFLEGVSPYGCLDMAGNVWEWTRSLWGPWDGKSYSSIRLQFAYPYNPEDGRENLEADDKWCRVLRGGAFRNSQNRARCAFRNNRLPSGMVDFNGFRVVVAPSRA